MADERISMQRLAHLEQEHVRLTKEVERLKGDRLKRQANADNWKRERDHFESRAKELYQYSGDLRDDNLKLLEENLSYRSRLTLAESVCETCKGSGDDESSNPKERCDVCKGTGRKDND